MTTILCVEDDAHIRDDIALELTEAGFECIQAEDGKSGLEQILEHKPDLVVSDIRMPEMTGTEMVAQLRDEHPQFAETPVIFLSALADRSDILDGITLGGDDYLTKPIDFEYLIAKTKAALRQSTRCKKRKEQEQVILYKSLTKAQTSEQETPARAPLEQRKIALVGQSDKGLWQVLKVLEELDQDVRVFTSGRAYLNKIEDGKLKPGLSLLWFQTDDMQAIMIPRMSADKSIDHVLVVPEELYSPGMSIARDGFIGSIGMPIEDNELDKKLRGWLAPAAAASTAA